ncbi:MAG: hypothetical protein P8H59_02770 [Flavobacteriales bacterium]|nr:hypothetical protein [Flavobacteriales bacterium]
MHDPLKSKLGNSPPEAPGMLEGHEDRFLTKALAQKSKAKETKVHPIWKWSAIAAAASILIVVAVVFQIKEDNQVLRQRTLSDVSSQVGQLELRMSSKISAQTASINMEDPAIQTEVQKFQALEAEYTRLEEALNMNFGDERIVKAMMDNYKRRLQVLQTMLTHIKLQQLKEKTEPKAPTVQS